MFTCLALRPDSVRHHFQFSLLDSKFEICNSYIANSEDHFLLTNPFAANRNYIVLDVQPTFLDYVLFRRPISIQLDIDDRHVPGGLTCESTDLYAHPFGVSIVGSRVDSTN